MICPKCRNEVSDKWCRYCGTQIEADAFDITPYDDEYERLRGNKRHNNSKNSSTVMLIIVICAILVIVSVVALFTVKLSSQKTVATPVPSSAQEETNNAGELIEKATRYMDAGNYESAEQICKEIIDEYSSDKAEEMYKILYNFSNASKEIANYKHKAARKFFEKIPDSYIDYSISDDVKALDEEITQVQVAYEILDNVAAFIADKNYSDAYSEISIIDSEMLNPDDRTILENYKKKIYSNFSPENGKKSSSDDSDASISLHDAEDLIHGYCDALVTAIKTHNFDLVAKYMHPDSKLYAQQKEAVNSYINKGTTKRLDSFHLDSVTKTAKNKWDAVVRESETIYLADGIKKQYNHTWTYTIEYIDSAFYLTNLK